MNGILGGINVKIRKYVASDDSIDYYMAEKEFNACIVGSLISRSEDNYVVRVRGSVTDLSKLVFSKQRLRQLRKIRKIYQEPK